MMGCFQQTAPETCAADVRSDDTASVPVDTGEPLGVRDLQDTYPDPPENGLQILTPTLEVPPYSEVFFCFYGTYRGPDVGVVSLWSHSVSDYNHHSLLMAASDEDPEDGSIELCMFEARSDTLFQAVMIEGEDSSPGDWLSLPEGYGGRLQDGQRWVLETHYINPTADTLLVNDAINLEFVPAEEITYWIAAYESFGDPDIPANSTASYKYDCVWTEDYEVLTLFGHMHQYGDAFTVDWTHNGTSERVYEVTDWRPEYRENPRPVTASFQPGEFQVQAGDVFTTECTWTNPTGQDIAYPTEMCSLHGVISPAVLPILCEGQAL